MNQMIEYNKRLKNNDAVKKANVFNLSRHAHEQIEKREQEVFESLDKIDRISFYFTKFEQIIPSIKRYTFLKHFAKSLATVVIICPIIKIIPTSLGSSILAPLLTGIFTYNYILFNNQWKYAADLYNKIYFDLNEEEPLIVLKKRCLLSFDLLLQNLQKHDSFAYEFNKTIIDCALFYEYITKTTILKYVNLNSQECENFYVLNIDPYELLIWTSEKLNYVNNLNAISEEEQTQEDEYPRNKLNLLIQKLLSTIERVDANKKKYEDSSNLKNELKNLISKNNNNKISVNDVIAVLDQVS